MTNNLTQLLNSWTAGDPTAGEVVMSQVYADLRRIAAKQLADERPDHTLQPTALVHEAYLHLSGLRRIRWQGRSHFFGSAAQQIRRILVDHARKHATAKRGDGQRPLALQDVAEPGFDRPAEVLALDRALSQLEDEDPMLATIVLQRFFGGLNGDEIGDLLGISPATVKRRWRVARAWLHHQLAADA